VEPREAVLIITHSQQGIGFSHDDFLRKEGFDLVRCGSGAEGIEALQQWKPAMVLLDSGLSNPPALEVCRTLRAGDPVVPVLLLGGPDDEASAVRALNAGADDYIARTTGVLELMARVAAQLRKATVVAQRLVHPDPVDHTVYRLGEVEVDLRAHKVRASSEPVLLGPLEFRLLEYLCRNAGVALSRAQILNDVYGYRTAISPGRVDLLFRRLRAKLGPGPLRGDQLVPVRGFGYRLERRGYGQGIAQS
jgi:DNA-binding response OmpR family regulator